MNKNKLDYFRIPESLKGEYRRWKARQFEGWGEAALMDRLARDQVSRPERLFKLPGTRIVRDRRNLTARISIDGRPVWIKRFRSSGALDRFIYGAGPGKAAYAWNAAMALMRRGFCTPKPLIGLRRTGQGGGVEGVVAFEELGGCVSLSRMLADDSLDTAGRTNLMNDLGDGLRRFHDSGFRHRDLRQGNILIARSGERWTVCFLDLNRLRIQKPLTRMQRLREVEKLNLPVKDLPFFFDAYMPQENSTEMATIYRNRVLFADYLEHLPLGKLIRKAWYYSWELRAFSPARRP